MSILEEIRTHFASLTDGLRQLTTVSGNNPAYSLRYNGEFGVAFDFESDTEISEESTNAKISTRKVCLDSGDTKKLLLLTCYDEEYRNEFAYLCENFVRPGEYGELRESLLKKPLAWWDRWIGLLGDRKGKKMCYNYIAEMMILLKLVENGENAIWAACEKGSHDIECEDSSYEVKSTIKKSDLVVSISSQHQLFAENDLFLVFVRMEKSSEGVSVNDMEKNLINAGYDKDLLSKQLADFGLVKGSRIRDEKYKVLEIRKYIVNDKFPKITKDSFVNGTFPQSITKINYSIDLANLPYDLM